ncbi:YiiX/YebB-like N1pC/P60 family cysteine hydrolase [Salimicrobium flavidum]|uniref:Permuted papain-like amidase enzyme, YaeF/YiiX, C92 family n=1 Tax=Salimicrobium flavidum TaxID=570947 RepID=A0A1N7K978_9BACI|nr:YiiX/YebB-like N1pC/P60 family cysteine hydrolase [Salimicrobium flavidum]SIS58108.1 Permuted papain-like amidase enzyme, YaeF/YiiX, C92 family [Salimicrobium flavidum]
MKKLITGIMTFLAVFLFIKPKKVLAPRSQPEVKPGDLLFSPLGQKDSFYIGHVGIVTEDMSVIHSIPKGLKKDDVDHFFGKFKRLSLYRSKSEEAGTRSAAFALHLYESNTKAPYRFFTKLKETDGEQYCTKLVWQAYYYGAGINLKKFPLYARAIHPEFVKDSRHLYKVGSY